MSLAIHLSLAAAFALSAWAGAPGQAPDELARELDDVARVASIMVDGDVCRRIPAPHAFKPDPRDPWQAADNYDVDHAAFIQTKKTLARLGRLCTHACDVNLWAPVAGKTSQVEMLIRNVHEISQFWVFGALGQDMPSAMKQVFEKQSRVTVRVKPGMVSVLAPVFDSLGDVVALVEVASGGRPKGSTQ